MSVSGAIFDAVVLYAAAGVVTAFAFASLGISRVLPHPVPATFGARILLLPGAFVLWPYVLFRWHKTRRNA